ncbi:HNH endonuclease [Floricoccus tropicus]|uniref:HNH endonuclease n=1 Tax=Floricoccus tropicus TaxID=1859473 RepID=A0A1E8GMR0_9LACT|nr:HNH endonuclease signature motif containing protein [Floricoccus tropicus]OFI49534.1 HNH endonuclease [Floricoccus tropicus]
MVRADKQGPHRVAFEKNRKRLLKTDNVCGICGQLIDKKLKAPDPMSAVVDHIIPVSKGGHPSDIDNLQLAHWTCNRQKSDKLFNNKINNNNNNKEKTTTVLGNRNLPQSIDWVNYKAK